MPLQGINRLTIGLTLNGNKMNRTLAFAIFVLTVSNLAGQDNRVISANSNGCWSVFDLGVKYFSDSLIFAKDAKHLPAYLGNYIFDWQQKNSLKSCLLQEEIVSLRKAILDRVYDEKILNWIITSKNKDYDKRYEPEVLKREIKNSMYNTFPIIPYMQYSWRELAENRLKEIQNTKTFFIQTK